MNKNFNKMVQRSVGLSSASENSPLMQENARESAQLSLSSEQPTATNIALPLL